MGHVPLKDQLKRLLNNKNISELKLNNGESVEDVLMSEAKKLLYILQEEIENTIYSRPASRWYERSYDFRNSLNTDLVIDNKTNTIIIGFQSDKAWHKSWITKQGNSSYTKLAYTPAAIIEGYEVFNTGIFIPGIDFIQIAVDRFNKEKRTGITVEIQGKNALMGAWWK